MKAVVYLGPGDIRVEEYPDPMPTRNNLIVAVHCCAICGTDLKLATVGNPRCHPPRVIGHEMVGSIVHVGSVVQGFAVGERITLATTLACGNCPYCNWGLSNLCPNSRPISYDIDGAFADYMAIPPEALAGENVIKVPDCVPDEAAALSEPLSCAINAQDLAGVRSGDGVLIIGGGPLGAVHAELAKALGAGVVILTELSEPRLSMLRRLCGVRVVDSSSEDLASIVADCTNDLGADVVIVCAPTRSAHEEAFSYVRKGGAISLFASLPKNASEIAIDSRTVHYGELRIVGASDSRPEHVARGVQLMAEGRIDAQSITTHRVPLEDFGQGLRLMRDRESLKVMVYPQGVPG